MCSRHYYFFTCGLCNIVLTSLEHLELLKLVAPQFSIRHNQYAPRRLGCLVLADEVLLLFVDLCCHIDSHSASLDAFLPSSVQ